MAERMKLVVGATTIELSPTEGMNRPEARSREINKVHGARVEIHEFGAQEAYELPLLKIAKADADNINDWYDNMNVITFTPDLQGDPGTTIPTIIANKDRPLQMRAREGKFDDKYIGTLELYETSSSSFSSSSSISSSSSSPPSSSSSSFSLSSSSSSQETGFCVPSQSLSSGSDSASLSSGSDSASDSSVSNSKSCSSGSDSASLSTQGGSSSLSKSSVSTSCSLSSGSDSGSQSSVSNSASKSSVSNSESNSSCP